MKKIRMLIFVPNEHPKVIRDNNELIAVLDVLKTHNEDCYGAHAMRIDDNIYIIYPKLIDILEYEGTRKFNDDIICGTFLIVKTNNTGLVVSLDYRNLLKYAHEFWSNSLYPYQECIQSYYNLAYKELSELKID